jgi:nucleoid-associated protein YgaU
MPISYEAVFDRLSPQKKRKSIRWIFAGAGLAIAALGVLWWSTRQTAEAISWTDSPVVAATDTPAFDMNAARDELAAMIAPAPNSGGALPVASVTPPVQPAPPVVRTETPRPPALVVAEAGSRPTIAASSVPPGGAAGELRAIDQILNTDPAAARDRLAALIPTLSDPATRAQALYRQGFAASRLRDEAGAEAAFLRAAAEAPESLDGRLAALAAADLWARRYFAAGRRDPSKFERLQGLYAAALGIDNGPFMTPAIRRRVVGTLEKLADELVFGAAPLANPVTHTLREGELLSTVARQYRVEFEAIARANHIENPNRIRAGTSLRIPVGEVSVVVRKNMANREEGPRLQWFLDGRLIREYAACVGDGDKTPAGEYTIAVKSVNPEWTDPKTGMRFPFGHPENILGTRWMALQRTGTSGLGIHGTTLPGTIPGYTSAGCVRLLDGHAEELYAFIRSGARVTIVD